MNFRCVGERGRRSAGRISAPNLSHRHQSPCRPALIGEIWENTCEEELDSKVIAPRAEVAADLRGMCCVKLVAVTA